MAMRMGPSPLMRGQCLSLPVGPHIPAGGDKHASLNARVRDGRESPQDGNGKGRCGHPAVCRLIIGPVLGGPLPA